MADNSPVPDVHVLPAGVFRGRNDAFNVPGKKSAKKESGAGGARRREEDLQTRSSEEEH